ncbi:MAG: hypothetical protein DMF50_01730, partial [Acidobacteria bacterium]
MVVTDTAPANTTYVGGSITGTGANAGGAPNLVWNIGNMAGGTSQTLTFQVLVSNPVPAGTASVSNTATIDSNETTPIVTNAATTSITAAPNFALSTKAATDLNGGLVTTGDTLRYTIVVRNSGNMNATGVVVTDTVPAGMTYVGGSITGTGADASGAPNLVWNIGALNGGGATTTLTFDAVIADAVAGGTVISNTGSVDSAQTTPVSTSTASRTVQAGYTGTLTSTATINPGNTVNLTLTDRNLNASPTVVNTVTLTTVNSVTGESETRTYTETGVNTGIFTATVATVFGAGAGTNNDGTFNVQSGDTLVTTYNDALTATGGAATVTATTVVVQVVLTLSKSDAPDPVNAGSNITYTLSYANTGGQNATGVVITDTIPANTSFVSATAGGTLAAGVVTWNIGNLVAGASASVQLVVAVASPLANGTVITNGTYNIDSNETAPTNGAAITTTVSSAP